jgi:hypothetical protein
VVSVLLTCLVIASAPTCFRRNLEYVSLLHESGSLLDFSTNLPAAHGTRQ